MTPTDLGLTGAALLAAVTEMFTTMAPFLLVVLPVIAVTIGVRWGIGLARSAAKGKTK